RGPADPAPRLQLPPRRGPGGAARPGAGVRGLQRGHPAPVRGHPAAAGGRAADRLHHAGGRRLLLRAPGGGGRPGLGRLGAAGVRGAAELARAVAAGELPAREAVDAHLARIDAVNPRLNALTRVLSAEPLGDGPLAGVPFTVKENIDLAGTPTTFGLTG